jgi:GTP-binding protein
MAFIDEARIQAIAGAGGDGAVAFHHEPYKPKGGPDGGDGGDGGSVILRADPSVGTLLELRGHPHVKAERGGHGQGGRRTGGKGRDRVVLVPPGTVVHDTEGVLLADLAAAGDEFVAARGGRGGLGNARFVTPTRRAPGFADRGEPGEERSLQLELRLLADVGVIGFPNAGKSTLVARLSSARPKIAAYPFTTLAPTLGVVEGGDTSFVIADIPGLIPGAHRGKGLGDRFLRHVRRAAVLLYLVDLAADDRDPLEDVAVLRSELASFDRELAERPWLLRALVVVAPMGFLAIEAGWVVTEVGRQPWIVYNLLRTADAVTPMPGLVVPFTVFTLLYCGLGLIVVFLIRRQILMVEGRGTRDEGRVPAGVSEAAVGG